MALGSNCVPAGIIEARQYLSSRRRMPSFTSPIDPTNPHRLASLPGWTARAECVRYRMVGRGVLDDSGGCSMEVYQSGSYIFRVRVPGYEPSESDIIHLHKQQAPAATTAAVPLRHKWFKCLLILSRTSEVDARGLVALKGEAVASRLV